MTEVRLPRLLFVTGRLAEHALRQVIDELAPRGGFVAEVAVMPISVAALMTPRWVARHLEGAASFDRVILPGHCRGNLAEVAEKAGTEVVLGPEDLRDLPRFLGQADHRKDGYGAFDIEILAEINHAPQMSMDAILAEADRFVDEGADRIDLGCDPGDTWSGVGDTVRALCERGYKVSIDSFNSAEVMAAVAAGADLVLSVNHTNREQASDWGVEVVAIPDRPGGFDGLESTINDLSQRGVRFRVDPILEPIGFGFAASLYRYFETRHRYPDIEILMGVGNLTELTDVDSAGVNTILIGLCQEIGVRSVLTTSVINWARSSVKEIDLARRLVYHSITRKTLPKHLEPRLVALRDPKPHRYGAEVLASLARAIKDPNWRIFAENGLIHAMNHLKYLRHTDPFILFEQMQISDPSHAFYLGYELMKAKTALTLNKDYRQDQALDWGFLTEPEVSHRERSKRNKSREADSQGLP